MNRRDAEERTIGGEEINRRDAEQRTNRQDAKSAKVGREEEEVEEGEERIVRRESIEPGDELDWLAHRVIGAAIEVHKHLGPGFQEAVYEEALELEFRLQDVPHERRKRIAVGYKDRPVGESRLDFLVGECLIVELKAVEALAPIHRAQVISYLKTTGLKLALLINFHVPVLKDGIKRIILT